LPNLSGSAVTPLQNEASSSDRDQSYGRQACPAGISHAALRDELRRPGGGVLRGPTPQTTDSVSEVESRPARIPNHRSSGGLNSIRLWRSFWREFVNLQQVPSDDRTLESMIYQKPSPHGSTLSK